MDYRFNIALIYDFDGTLAPGNMQEYDFIPAVGKSNKEFWTEANTLAEEQDADMTLTYMAKMLEAARSRKLSLRREAFQDSGRRVTLFAGVKEWFSRINPCGFTDRGVTSIAAETGSQPSMQEVKQLVIRELATALQCEITSGS